MPVPVRVTLKWIQITDNLEPGRHKEGEFVFRTRVETDAGEVVETRLPEEGSWFISQKPGKNRVKLDEVVFEGEAEARLVVELTGEEQDRLTASDALETYRREFTGSPADWAGLHAPGDEGEADPENLANWRIGYEIELV